MTRQFSFTQAFLWLFIIFTGIEIGGGLYEALVVVPLWSFAPPDSVIAYHQHNLDYPQLAINAGGRFWMFFTPIVGLLALTVILSGFKTQPEHRRWRLTSGIIAFLLIVTTFAWFVPNIMILTKGGAGLNGEQITSLVHWWVRLNWVRVVVALTAWITGIRALTIPAKV